MTFTLIQITLLSTVAIGAATDLVTHKIYNFITLPLALVGVLYHAVQGGLPGVVFSLAGLGLGLALYLPLCMAKIMGAGDAKLLAAIGAVAGWKMAMNVGLFAIMIGGLFALILLCINGRFFPWLSQFRLFLMSLLMPGAELELPKLEKCHWMPFGPAIFAALMGLHFGVFTPFIQG